MRYGEHHNIDAVVDQIRMDTMSALQAQVEQSHAACSASAVGGSHASAREARPSLEEVTLNNRFHSNDEIFDGADRSPDAWTLKVVRYESGVVEVRAALFGSPPVGRIAGAQESSKASSRGDAARYASSIKRSRKTIRERCLQLNADHMLTLTKRGKFSSTDEAWKAFNRFNRLMTKLKGNAWQYVAVPEMHADGETFHMHIAVRGFYWAGLVRKLWQKALGGTGYESGENTLGNVDLKAFRRTRSGATAVRRIAGYIAKYIGKGAESVRMHRKLFATSRGLHPTEVSWFHIRDWAGIPEVCLRVQRWLSEHGADPTGHAFFWSRHSVDDERLLATGFVISTNMKQV